MIRVVDVVKDFGSGRVLDGASLTVRPGEVTALVGPSGGGKSTLLRCVNGLETFDAGRIEAFGHVLHPTGARPHPTRSLVALRRDVGMVFQQFHLFPHMTALENVAAGPVFALGEARAAAEGRARQLLDRVGLGHKAGARPGELSGGQQQRVAIARTLAVNPRAVLFDEPTSALDPASAADVVAVFKGLASAGLTLIVVTHDFDLARAAHTAHRMAAGRVAASGAPAEVLRADGRESGLP